MSFEKGRNVREGNGFATRGRGRPVEFTPELGAKVVVAMRAGNYLETAASCIGFNIKVVRNWRVRGLREARAVRKGERAARRCTLASNDFTPNVYAALQFLSVLTVLTDPVQWTLCESEWFASFSECLTMAEGEAESRSLSFIQRASAENPQAAMWFLARRFPRRWGAQAEVTVSGEGGASVGVVILPPEDPNG